MLITRNIDVIYQQKTVSAYILVFHEFTPDWFRKQRLSTNFEIVLCERVNQAYRRSIPTSIAASKEPMTATLASTLSAPDPFTIFDTMLASPLATLLT